jgi:hypothetical protein
MAGLLTQMGNDMFALSIAVKINYLLSLGKKQMLQGKQIVPDKNKTYNIYPVRLIRYYTKAYNEKEQLCIITILGLI